MPSRLRERKREILSQVAEGSLSPSEAAARLEELERDERGQESAEKQRPADSTPEPAQRIRVATHYGQVEIIGDPSVKEAIADGRHAARRAGDLLVIEGEEWFGDIPGFTFSRRSPGWDSARWWIGMRRGWEGLTVCMNPNLPLEATSQAGSIRIRDIVGPIRADIQAGSANITGFAAPIELLVQAGTVNAAGRLDQGGSRIRCETGSVHLRLAHGSSVQIRARTNFGRVNLPGHEGWVIGGDVREVTVGSGSATLEIEAAMGSVSVEADQ